MTRFFFVARQLQRHLGRPSPLSFSVKLCLPRDVVILTCACHSILLFLFGFGARVVRILQDFAGIYRAILLKFFRVSTGWATHNP